MTGRIKIYVSAITALITVAFFGASPAGARNLPESVLRQVDRMMVEGLEKGYYPGASIAIGNRNGILFEKCYGVKGEGIPDAVTFEDVYDIASVTKVVSTTFAVMRLYDEKMIDLNKTVGDYISCYRDTPVHKITVTQLLTHTSGLPYFPVYSLLFTNGDGGSLISSKQSADHYPHAVDKGCYICANPVGDPEYISTVPLSGYRRAGEGIWVAPWVDKLIISKIASSYSPDRRGKYLYTDSNFYILRQIVEAVTGRRLDSFAEDLFRELDMYDTGYNPLEWKPLSQIIPTEYDRLMQRGLVRGYVHDDLAAVNNNIEGNAGLFSNVRDLSNFCRMMLNRGTYRGKRVISAATIDLFTSSPLSPRGIYRGLGFDKRAPSSSLYNGYGHTGYTGTMIWMDPEKDIFMVFLSNRVNPSRLNNGLVDSQLRFRIWSAIKEARK